MDELLDSAVNMSDEEAEAMTPAEVLQELEEAWLNEKFAPELLESKSEIVDCIMEQITEMEENINRAKKGSSIVSTHKMELDRVRFIVSSYLRTRLRKIETYYSHVLEEDRTAGDSSKLSPQEVAYAKEYKDNVENHMKVLALRQMPQNLQSLDTKQTKAFGPLTYKVFLELIDFGLVHCSYQNDRTNVIHPPLDSYIFLRVKEDTEGVMVEEETTDSREEIIDLEKGDQHIMPYRPISSLVTSGAVTLI